MPPIDPQLSRLLRTWRLDPALPPGFAAGVWRRLAARQRAAAELPSDWLARLAERFGRPRFALAFGTLLLLVGAGAGAWQGRSGSNALAEDLRSRYIQSIDPFAPGRP